jgi:hypothetical protein
MSWHMVECTEPGAAEAHCPEGQLLLNAGPDPDGHCLVNGVCLRCRALEAEAAARAARAEAEAAAAEKARQAPQPPGISLPETHGDAPASSGAPASSAQE